MKPIIVATDFSGSADYAMHYAARLAQEIHTSLVLLHTYQMPVSMSDMPVMMISAEELKYSTDKSLEEARQALQQNFPGLKVEVEGRLGDLVDELNDVCNKVQPLAVVIGSKGYKGLEKLLFGNTPMAIIRRCRYPVISVPENSRPGKPQNIVLATDLEQIEDVPAPAIAAMVKLLQARLHVVYVKSDEELPEAARDQLLESLKEVKPVFHAVKDEDVIKGLRRYVEENHIDLLIALPHKHNLYEKLFFRLHTEGMIEKLPIPVMCL